MGSQIKLELLKHKEEHARSAIASQEVREHLAGFIRSKRQGSSGSANQINIIGPCVSSQLNGRNGHSSICKSRRSQSQLTTGSLANGANNAANPTPIDLQTTPNQSNHSTSHHNRKVHNSTSSSDDHPLRKTASMPIINTPIKPQSLSRRRQIERRTTMSPLMKRKSRAPSRREKIRSLDLADGQEYSSNPCIIQGAPFFAIQRSGLTQRSLSQSNSPPQSGAGIIAHACEAQQIDLAGVSRSSMPNNPGRHSSSISQTNISNLSSSAGSQIMTAIDNDPWTKRQQHRKVQEAIRKTVINRASSRARMAIVGGSLDSNELAMAAARVSAANRLMLDFAGSSTTNDQEQSGQVAPEQSDMKSMNPCAVVSGRSLLYNRADPHRQWSLDSADLKSLGTGFSAPSSAICSAHLAATAANANSQANRTLAWGSFNRELHHLRLATTNEASLLRPSKSPQSSISMGLSLAKASTDPSSNSNVQQQTSSDQVTSRLTSQLDHLPLSSSSDSSLVSGQGSIDDSSSQAIDLSSSGDVNRQRQQQQEQQQQANLQLSRLNYQKVLQDSFNQLQLQSREGSKSVVLPSSQQFCFGDQQQQQQNHLISSQDQINQLDLSQWQTTNSIPLAQQPSDQLATLASMAEQFNLSASAQNLISTHTAHDDDHRRRQQFHLDSVIVQQHNQQNVAAAATSADLNPWSMAYTNLVQSNEFQQSDQITSSLWIKITSLPEPYRSALLTQWVYLHQSQMLIDEQNASNSAGQGPNLTHLHDQRSLISRTLSSPLLMASGPQYKAADFSCHHEASQPGGDAGRLPIDLGVSMVEGREQHHGASLESGSGSSSNSRMIVNDLGDADLIASSGLKQHYEQASLYYSLSNLAKTTARSPINKATSRDWSVVELNGRQKPTSDQILAAADKSRQNADQCTSFSFIPHDMAQTSCNFIYNPEFDPNSTTGLVYELEMCNHKCICQNEAHHPENSFRALAIWRRLFDVGLMAKCARIEGRRASLNELQLCHSETYSNYFGKTPYERIKLKQLDLSELPIEGLTQLECGGQGADIDTAWNEEQTPGVARLAAGCVIEAAVSVAEGRLQNAFAIVRPPGHHAEFQQAMGFCFFNSIAIATRVLQLRHQVERVLIIDWDVHHGNGIQKLFYDDKNVMYISLHRHDKGNFFPGTGDLHEFGVGQGEGFNWNIAWSNGSMGDAEYLAAFRSIVMPISREFNPSIVLVACGFDGARGHPFNFGGYDLTPACFAYMTDQLMSLSNGRVVLCLEGGYHLQAICDCAEACVRVLLNEPDLATADLTTTTNIGSCRKPINQLDEAELRRIPSQSAVETLFEVSCLAAKYWPSVNLWRPTIEMSAIESQRRMAYSD